MRQTNMRWAGYQGQFDDANTSPSIGGDVYVFNSGAALNVGDVVYISGVNTVNKSAVAGNQSKVIGVVVGGAAIPDKNLADFEQVNPSLVVGQAATTGANQQVLVCVYGVVPVKCDGAVAQGAPVKASSTVSGSVTSATAGTDAGLVIGKLIDAAAVNNGDVRNVFISAM